MPAPSRKFLNLQPQPPAHALSSHSRTESWVFCFRLVSANVQTLEENRPQGLLGRVPFVRLQLEAVGALIIGLQETRAKQTETYESSTHLRFLAKGDEKGNLGVELWFAKTIPFGWQDDRPCFFQADDFRVLSWSPRHLAVRLVRGPLHVLVVTCHAPTVTDPSRHEWWQSFAKQVLGIAKGDQVVLLGDFNTRLTEPWQPRVGDLCWEQGPEPPDPLLDLLAKLDMWVPATFSSCHVGLSHTWVSPGHGSTSRIDYICVPNEWQCASESSQVLYQVDFGQAGVDHYAVQLTASFSLRAASLPSRRRPKMDIAKMRDPAALATVQEICQSVPLVPWEVDPHTHYGIISDHLRPINAVSSFLKQHGHFDNKEFGFVNRSTSMLTHVALLRSGGLLRHGTAADPLWKVVSMFLPGFFGAFSSYRFRSWNYVS